MTGIGLTVGSLKLEVRFGIGGEGFGCCARDNDVGGTYSGCIDVAFDTLRLSRHAFVGLHSFVFDLSVSPRSTNVESGVGR